MKTATVIIFSLLIVGATFAQSKKVQIEHLNLKLDSLNNLFLYNKMKHIKETDSLNNVILENKIKHTKATDSLKKLNYTATKNFKEYEFIMERKLQNINDSVTYFKNINEDNLVKIKNTELGEKINFQNHLSGPKGSNRVVKINKSSDKDALGQLKYALEEQGALRQNKINFASYYEIITYGVGTGCSQGIMIDLRDGMVYSVPIECPACMEEDDQEEEFADHKEDSLLLVNTYCRNILDNEIKVTDNYLWSEKTKKFVYVR